ncbi:hypothetical protein HN446_00790 [bacterium]|jgi:hypothetical protein|nr:hypothetical protein [bacterium]
MKKLLLLASLSIFFVAHISSTPMDISLLQREFEDDEYNLKLARDVIFPAIIDGTFFKTTLSGIAGFCTVTQQNITWLLDALKIWKRSDEGRIRDINYYLEKAAKEILEAQTEYGDLIELVNNNETQNEVGLKKAIRKMILQKHGHSLYPHYDFMSELRKYTWYSNKHNTYAHKLIGMLQEKNLDPLSEELNSLAVLVEIIEKETAKIQKLIDTTLDFFAKAYQSEMRQRETLHAQQRTAMAIPKALSLGIC